jgi:hypothetical protein
VGNVTPDRSFAFTTLPAQPPLHLGIIRLNDSVTGPLAVQSSSFDDARVFALSSNPTGQHLFVSLPASVSVDGTGCWLNDQNVACAQSGSTVDVSVVNWKFPSRNTLQIQGGTPNGPFSEQVVLYLTDASSPPQDTYPPALVEVFSAPSSTGQSVQVGPATVVSARPFFVLLFSEPVDPLSIVTLGGSPTLQLVRTGPGAGPVPINAATSFDGQMILVAATATQPPGQTLDLIVGGARDLNGNLAVGTHTSSYVVESEAAAPVLIAQQPASSTGEPGTWPTKDASVDRHARVMLTFDQSVRLLDSPDTLFGFEVLREGATELAQVPIFGWQGTSDHARPRNMSTRPVYAPVYGAEEPDAGALVRTSVVARDEAGNATQAIVRDFYVAAATSTVPPWIDTIDLNVTQFPNATTPAWTSVSSKARIDDCARVLSARYYTASASVPVAVDNNNCSFGLSDDVQLVWDQLQLHPGSNPLTLELTYLIGPSASTGPTGIVSRSTDLHLASAPPRALEAAYTSVGTYPIFNADPAQAMGNDQYLFVAHIGLLSSLNGDPVTSTPLAHTNGRLSAPMPLEPLYGSTASESDAKLLRVGALMVQPDYESSPVTVVSNYKGVHRIKGLSGLDFDDVAGWPFHNDPADDDPTLAGTWRLYSPGYGITSFGPVNALGYAFTNGTPGGATFVDSPCMVYNPAINGCVQLTAPTGPTAGSGLPDPGTFVEISAYDYNPAGVGAPADLDFLGLRNSNAPPAQPLIAAGGSFTFQTWMSFDTPASMTTPTPLFTIFDTAEASIDDPGNSANTIWQVYPNAAFYARLVNNAGGANETLELYNDPTLGVVDAPTLTLSCAVGTSMRDGAFHELSLRVEGGSASEVRLFVDGIQCGATTTLFLQLKAVVGIVIGAGYYNDKAPAYAAPQTVPDSDPLPPFVRNVEATTGVHVDATGLRKIAAPVFDIEQNARNNGKTVP